MGGRGGAWQSRKLSFCCCVPFRRRPDSPKSPSLTLSLFVCVKSYLPLPPLSSPLIDSSFRLPLVCTLRAPLSLLPLTSRPSRFAVVALLVLSASQKVGYSFYCAQKKRAFVLACLLVWPVVFSSFFSPPLVSLLVLPRCPPLSLAEACVASSRPWRAERRKMKAQSSKMHQHEY